MRFLKYAISITSTFVGWLLVLYVLVAWVGATIVVVAPTFTPEEYDALFQSLGYPMLKIIVSTWIIAPGSFIMFFWGSHIREQLYIQKRLEGD